MARDGRGGNGNRGGRGGRHRGGGRGRGQSTWNGGGGNKPSMSPNTARRYDRFAEKEADRKEAKESKKRLNMQTKQMQAITKAILASDNEPAVAKKKSKAVMESLKSEMKAQSKLEREKAKKKRRRKRDYESGRFSSSESESDTASSDSSSDEDTKKKKKKKKKQQKAKKKKKNDRSSSSSEDEDEDTAGGDQSLDDVAALEKKLADLKKKQALRREIAAVEAAGEPAADEGTPTGDEDAATETAADDTLVGKLVSKKFDGHGVFQGKVTDFDTDSALYTVQYIDSDEETMDETELRKILLKPRPGTAASRRSPRRLGGRSGR